MRALVTGGGGFLGGCLTRTLLDRGYDVTVFGRGDYPKLAALGARSARGDVRDLAAISEVIRDHEVVFHVAAKTGIWGPRREFWSVNVDGTRNVVDGCRRAGVAKLVYTSTPSVVFGRNELCGVDESQPYPKAHLCEYAASKAEAERVVLAANHGDLATVALRPHLIWGPGDPHLIPRIIERARAGRLVQVGDGKNQVDITFVDNAVEAQIRAAEALHPNAACAGRPYFIGNEEPVRLWDWIQDLLARLGISPIRRRLSLRAAYRMGVLMEAVYRVWPTRSEPPMTRFVALQLGTSHYFSHAAARRDLGYEPGVKISDGTDRLVAWIREGLPGHRTQGKVAAAT